MPDFERTVYRICLEFAHGVLTAPDTARSEIARAFTARLRFARRLDSTNTGLPTRAGVGHDETITPSVTYSEGVAWWVWTRVAEAMLVPSAANP